MAVLSFHFWTRRFGADPAVVGRKVILKNQPFTVVGVTSPGFFGESVGRAPDIWVPLTWQPTFDGGRSLLDRANVGWLRVMGRLHPGMTREQAAAAMAVSLARVKTDPTDVGRFTRGLATIRVSEGSQGLSGFRESVLTAVADSRRRRRRRPADRVRECLVPIARAGNSAAARDGDPARHRRRPPAVDPAVPY